MQRVTQNKTIVLRMFAKKVPNAESMAIDYGRNTLTVWFDGIHSKEYKVSEIIEQFEIASKANGFSVVWE